MHRKVYPPENYASRLANRVTQLTALVVELGSIADDLAIWFDDMAAREVYGGTRAIDGVPKAYMNIRRACDKCQQEVHKLRGLIQP